MGILQSKKVTQKEKHPFNKDTKHGTAEEAVVKKAGDFNRGEANDLTGNTANTSPNRGNEATRLHQVPAVDAPRTREQSIHKADPVQYIPHLTSILTQKHTSPAKPKDKKNSTTILQQAAPERINQHPSRPSKPVQHQKKAAAPVQQQANRRVMCSQREFKCSFGTKAQRETLPQLPASKTRAPVRRTYSEVVRGVTTENLQSKDAETQTKANVDKSSRVLSYVTESSTDLTGHATDKARDAVEQNTATPGIAQVEAVTPIEGQGQGSNQSKAQVINGKNEPGDDGKSSQHTSEETVMEENTIKILQPYKNNTDTSSSVQKVNIKVPVVEDTAVTCETKRTLRALNQNQPNNNTRNVAIRAINWKNEVEREKQEPGVTPENKDRVEGRWLPFTVNQSCPRKVRCHHNPGTGLPPNVQKWCDEAPNYLREPPWVTTARSAACLALRETQEEAGDSHQ